MAIDLSLLEPELRDNLQLLLRDCAALGVVMRPYSGLRTPREQAALWRQSRSRETIESKIAQLRAQGAAFLAQCLEEVGPQNGPPVTKALPGHSWHNWGQAVDCFWLVEGQAEWSSVRLVNGVNGYRLYSRQAQALGLTAGGLWPHFQDWPHVQLPPEDSPAQAMTLAEIDQAMRRKFGGGA